MPTLTDDDQKSAIDQKVEAGHGAYAGAGIDQLEALANDPSQHSDDSVKEAEQTPDNSINYTGKGKQNLNQPKLQKALKFAKKRGGIIGLISLFGIGGGILAGFFGPASMIINMTENFSLSNDSSSTALERRFMKIFGNMTNPDNDVICANSSKNIKCKMGKISNKALNQLQKKGVVAVFDGVDYDGKKTGYPSKNPTQYKIDGATIDAKDLTRHLADNPKSASKILGTKGAINLRVKAWAGKHISQKFYQKFGLNKNGGIADGTNKRLTSSERLAAASEKLRERIPGAEKINQVTDSVKSKVGSQLGKAKKGGVAYTIAVAGCIGVRAPGYIAGAVAAVQLAQILPIAMDLVLSPGSKAKASGVDTENSITAEDMDTVGTLLTNKTKNSEGEMSSALDSPYLLAAMGVNKNKPGVSQNFAPGYSVLTNSVVVASQQAAKDSAPACNAILSPTAMWAAFAVDSAVTVAASATVVGGLAKIVLSWAVTEIVSAVAIEVAGSIGKDMITELASNDAIPSAQGEELGDVLGVSAAAFFSSGGMARNLPTLTETQLVAFNDMQLENESFQRDMDLATLSPFDISSRYTFLGSIFYNTRMGMINNGSYTISSALSSLAMLPSSLSNASASTNFTSQYCGYATDFGLNTEDKSTTPAINMAGLPCTGITTGQASMSTSDAIDLMVTEGWICNTDTEDCPEIKEGASLNDLMPSNDDGYKGNGYIKDDTLLYEYINSCSDPSTGDYLFNAAGCTVPTNIADGPQSSTRNECTDTGEEDDDGNSIQSCSNDLDLELEDGETTAEGVKNPRSLEAMSVFLLDFQAAQSINGEDEEVFTNNGSSNVSENSGKINPEGWAYPMDSPQTFTTYAGHSGNDIPAPEGSKIYSIRDGVVKLAEAQRFTYACPVTPQGPIQNNIEIESVVDGKTYLVRYAHLKDGGFNVKAGDTVKAGDLIGYTGNTGCSSGPHLHVDITVDGVRYSVFPVDIFGWSF